MIKKSEKQIKEREKNSKNRKSPLVGQTPFVEMKQNIEYDAEKDER